MNQVILRLIIAIVWIVVAGVCFSVNKIGVGIPWLLIGIINLVRAIRLYRIHRQVQAVNKRLEAALRDDVVENNDNPPQTEIEIIEFAEEVHAICDEYIGYGYVVNKAFKPAKSHAAEVELLCTYAPDDEYGEEGKVPYIAVQTDDEVYCAVEEFQESKTFDGAIRIEPAGGMFLFKAQRAYYDDMMYFYGFELGEEAYWDKAGLCLVYPKAYVGTKEEEKLMHILDEAAKTFQKDLE